MGIPLPWIRSETSMDLAVQSNRTRDGIYEHNKKLTWYVMFIFLIVNALKITLFDMFITGSAPVQAYMYKFGMTLILCTIIYIMISGIKYRFLFTVFYILQSVYIFINLVYYDYFHSYLHIAQAFALSSEGVGAAGDLSVLLSSKLLIVLLDLPLAVYIIFFAYPSIRRHIREVRRIKRLAVVLAGILVIGAVEGYNYVHKYSLADIAKANNSASEMTIVQRYGTLVNSIEDLALNKNTNSMISHLKYGQPISGSGTSDNKPNFVMIQVESMDSTAVNAQHDGQYVMPFLHSLSQQSVYYPYTMSYHEAGGTSDCEFSILDSMEPLGDYPAIEINDYSYPNSIVRQLDDNSYSTVAFHGDNGSYYSRDMAYPKIGYQNFYDLNKMGLAQKGWGAPDSDVFDFAEKTLKNVKQPFFAYTITMSSHGPFTNVNNYYNNKNYDDIQDQTTRDYMNSMSYVDQSIESFVNYIRANFKNTYIFIYGDHTPDVNSSDYKQASFTDNDKYFEFVPLIIVTPDNKSYQEKNIAASFLDIAPTVANASGIPYKLDSDGIDLLNRPGSIGDIPYRGGTFDRSYLFDRVSQTVLQK